MVSLVGMREEEILPCLRKLSERAPWAASDSVVPAISFFFTEPVMHLVPQKSAQRRYGTDQMTYRGQWAGVPEKEIAEHALECGSRGAWRL